MKHEKQECPLRMLIHDLLGTDEGDEVVEVHRLYQRVGDQFVQAVFWMRPDLPRSAKAFEIRANRDAIRHEVAQSEAVQPYILGGT